MEGEIGLRSYLSDHISLNFITQISYYVCAAVICNLNSTCTLPQLLLDSLLQMSKHVSKRARNMGYFNLHDPLEGNRYSLYVLVVFPRTTNFKDH